MVTIKSFRFVLFALALSSSASVLAATPPDWVVYCMLAREGRPPQKDVTVKYGETKDIFEEGNYVYKIRYGDIGNKILLIAFNKSTGLQSYAMASSDPLPTELTLTTEGAGIFTCFVK